MEIPLANIVIVTCCRGETRQLPTPALAAFSFSSMSAPKATHSVVRRCAYATHAIAGDVKQFSYAAGCTSTIQAHNNNNHNTKATTKAHILA